MEQVQRGRAVLALAALAIALGAGLRFSGLDLVWTVTDQTRDLTRAFAVASGAEFPLLGPAVGSSEFCLGPIYYYMLGLPALATRSPVGVFLFVALVNVAALGVFFLVVRRWLGATVAALSLVPYSLAAPWVIRAQVLSNPTLMPLFVIAFWACVVEAAVERRGGALPWALAVMAVLLQLHLSTAAFIPLALLVVLLFRPPVRAGALAAGVAAALALCLPYLYHECLHGWGNTLGLLDFLAGASTPAGRAGRGAVAADLIAWFTAGPRFLSALAPGRDAWYRVFLTENILAAGGVAAALVYVGMCVARRNVTREARVCAVLLIWLLGTVAAALGRRGGIWLYYLDAAYPAPFIFMGIFLSAVWGVGAPRRSRFAAVARAAVVVYCAFLAALNVSVLGLYRAETARRGTASLPSFWLNIRSMDAWAKERFRYLSIMPMRFRRELADYFVAREGLAYGECARRLHGAYAGCFLEDKGFWVGWSERGREAGSGRAGIHYLIEGPDAPLTPPPARVSRARVGPFDVTGFRPALTVSSLEAHAPSGARLGTLDIPTGAAGFALPSASPVYRYWIPAFRPGARSAALEGALTAGPLSGPAALCVTVRSAEMVVVRDVLLDGKPVPPRSVHHLKTLTLVSTYSYHLRENPGPGPHRLSFTLASRAPLACDVDVYGYPTAQ